MFFSQYQPVEDCDREDRPEQSQQQQHTATLFCLFNNLRLHAQCFILFLKATCYLFCLNTQYCCLLFTSNVSNKGVYVELYLLFIFYFYRGIEMVSSIVEFQWYWYRLLHFWYRDNPRGDPKLVMFQVCEAPSRRRRF